jgi:hypothetical protein
MDFKVERKPAGHQGIRNVERSGCTPTKDTQAKS